LPPGAADFPGLFLLFVGGLIGLLLIAIGFLTIVTGQGDGPQEKRWAYTCLNLSVAVTLVVCVAAVLGGLLWAGDLLAPLSAVGVATAPARPTPAFTPPSPPTTLQPTGTVAPRYTITVRGTVYGYPDPAPLPGATVTATIPGLEQSAAPQATQSDEGGHYKIVFQVPEFRSAEPVEVQAVKPGFEAASAVGYLGTAGIDQVLTLNLKMPALAPLTPGPTPTTTISQPGDVTPFAPAMIGAERAALAGLDDPPRYTLEVTVDWERHELSGVERLSYTNNEGRPLPEIYLRLYPNAEHYAEGALEVAQVAVDGREVEYQVQDTVLKAPLSPPLPPEGALELAISFTVTVPHRPDRFGYDEGVMSLGHWYPMLAVYDDEGWHLDPYVDLGDAFYSETGLYTVQLTVPEEMVVAASGIEEGEVLHRAPRKTLTLRSGATRDFALALSPDYRVASGRAGEVTVNSYYLPGDEEAGRAALDVAVQAVQVYGELFGPYPYTELDVVETSFVIEGMPGGMEFPGIVFISSELYRPGLFADEQDTVIVHEIAHQWWYGVVGNDQVDDPWLDEAFATYSSILFFERAQGTEEAREQMLAQGQLPWLMTVMTGDDRPVGTSLLEFDDLITYSGIVYGKGAVFLARLREELGDEAFFAMLRRYYAGHKYGIVQPQDFLQAVREAPNGEQGAATYDRYVLRAEGMDDKDMAGLSELADLLKLLMGGKNLSPEELEQLLQELLKGREQ
jgi:hypothetical protein